MMMMITIRLTEHLINRIHTNLYALHKYLFKSLARNPLMVNISGEMREVNQLSQVTPSDK